MSLARVGKALLAVGAGLFVGAVVWWYLFYEQFLGTDVKRASECFYTTTEWCGFGKVLSVIGSIPIYSPYALWASAVTFVMGLLLLGLAPKEP